MTMIKESTRPFDEMLPDPEPAPPLTSPCVAMLAIFPVTETVPELSPVFQIMSIIDGYQSLPYLWRNPLSRYLELKKVILFLILGRQKGSL